MRADPAMAGSGEERLPNDAYFTRDPQCVDRLAEFFDFQGMTVLEPCAGRGHMVADLQRHGADVVAWEKEIYSGQPLCIQVGRDFFKQKYLPDSVEMIVTNPPFDRPAPFIRHALDMLPDGHVCMLLRHEWMCGKGTKDRRQELLCHHRFKAYAPILGRPVWYEERKASPRHNYGWFIWGSIHHGTDARLWL